MDAYYGSLQDEIYGDGSLGWLTATETGRGLGPFWYASLNNSFHFISFLITILEHHYQTSP